MYACILETGCGFFEGVCAPRNATAHFRDPPPPPTHGSRMVCSSAPPQGLPAAVNKDSPLQDVEFRKGVQGEEQANICAQ
jgi:hypothetical protein